MVLFNFPWFPLHLACENIRFSSLFVAEDVSRVLSDEERGETDVFAGYTSLNKTVLRNVRYITCNSM